MTKIVKKKTYWALQNRRDLRQVITPVIIWLSDVTQIHH